MTISLPAIGGTVLSLLMSGAPAQLSITEASPDLLQRVMNYRQLIEKYRRGDDATVEAVIAIPRIHLESILDIVFSKFALDPAWRPEECRRAAMLHTDAALRVVGPDEEDGPRRRHLDVAGRMLHASGAPDDPFVPRWYFAVSRALRQRDLYGVAQDLLERGRNRVPGNPTILYESATVAETLARGYSILVKETVSGIPSIESDAARNQQRRAVLLNDAARWLREALERDATLLEPRLHLGRVETLRGNETDALVHLERVFSSATDPATAYLAALFSGAAHERLRRPDAAEASYRRAIERLPAGQAAYVALSEVLQRSGKSAESQAVLHTLVRAKPGSGDEPWRSYLPDPPGVADERLAVLRREVRS